MKTALVLVLLLATGATSLAGGRQRVLNDRQFLKLADRVQKVVKSSIDVSLPIASRLDPEKGTIYVNDRVSSKQAAEARKIVRQRVFLKFLNGRANPDELPG